MQKKKCVGIWMDHSTANLIDYDQSGENQTIESDFTHRRKVEALNRSEHIMHNKEQQMNEAFYKEIAAEILNYDHVVLFGPTNAKNELNNILDKDLHYVDIKIDVESADKMSDNEQMAFVRNHFDENGNS